MGSRLGKIPRSTRDECWCGGPLDSFRLHSSYGVCEVCGTYVNRRPPTVKGLQELSSFDLYWHDKQRAHGFPSLENRVAADTTDGRVDYWISLVEKFGPRSGQVVEVGCAHGLLLKRLQDLGYRCLGVEVDPELARWVNHEMGVEVRAGIFPQVDLPPCDLFFSADVLEHSLDPEEFLRGAARLLRPGGIAIIQTCIDRGGNSRPFGEKFQYAFDDIEHLFLFTPRAVEEIARRTGLALVDNSEALWLMGEVFILRKDGAP